MEYDPSGAPSTEAHNKPEELLELLRQQNSRFAALEKKVELLEAQQTLLQTENAGLAQELAKAKSDKAELDWVFDNALDLYCAHDFTGKAVRVNRACEALLGYTQEEFLASSIEVMLHPDDIDRARHNIANIMAGTVDVHVKVTPDFHRILTHPFYA